MSNIVQLLNWRYATKKMNAAQQIPAAKLDTILEAIRLSASSSGLQPYQVLVITDPALKQQIRQVAWDQSQVTDCSHLLVFAAWDNYTAERINMMFDLVNEQRGFKNDGWEAYRQKLLAYYPQRPAEQNFEHAARQAYIGLGSALLAAAEQQVDATPMEGIDRNTLDRELGLADRGLRSLVMVSLGYRSDSDFNAALPKSRLPAERVFTHL